jgi:hypothetical protein
MSPERSVNDVPGMYRQLRITTRVPAPGLRPSAVTLRPVSCRAEHGPRQDSGFGNAGTLDESAAEEREAEMGTAAVPLSGKARWYQ